MARRGYILGAEMILSLSLVRSYSKSKLPKSSPQVGFSGIFATDVFLFVCSDQYHMGYTMRFPRALSIRDDLSIADCMTASGT